MFIIFSLFISVDFLLRLLLVQLWRQGNSTKSQVAMEYASDSHMWSDYCVPNEVQVFLTCSQILINEAEFVH